MKNVLKSKKIIICIMVFLALGAITGIMLTDSLLKSVPKKQETVTAKSTSDKNIEIKIAFTLCEHEIIQKHSLKTTETQNSTDALKEEKSLIIKTIDGFCPKHYVVRTNKDGKNFSVYKRDTVSLEEKHIMDIARDVETVGGEFSEELKKGVAFSSLEEINKYFENAES